MNKSQIYKIHPEQDSIIKERVCKKCGILRSIQEFHYDKYQKDGFKVVCRWCVADYYKHNKKRILEKCKSYREKNKYMIYKRTKIYKPIYNKEYRILKKEELNKYQKEYREKHKHRVWTHNTIMGHKKSGYIMEITKDRLEEIAKFAIFCKICGVKLDWSRKGNHNFQSPTLDRICNDKVIRENNIVIVCYQCNTGKNSASLNEYIEHCKKVINFQSNIKTENKNEP
jgi:hypothetical protein